MAAKQPTFGIAHATVVPRNFDPETSDADDANDAGGDEAVGAAEDGEETA